MITINNLSKRYTKCKKNTLDNVNLNIGTGEIVGLVGKNGAGKTTLLKCLTNMTNITSGSIFIDNINISNDSAIFKRVGLLMEPVFFEHLSAYDNIKFFLEINNNQDYITRIDEILEFVGLIDFKDKSPKNFSFGMKQKLGLSMCLIDEPDYLFMDEPFIGLDIDGINELTSVILMWAKRRKITAIISSHQLYELSNICNRYILINDGQVKELTDISSLMSREISYVKN